MRIVKTNAKKLTKKSINAEVYEVKNQRAILPTNHYFSDEMGNYYFCFAGFGEFSIDSTKNINYDALLEPNSFIDANDKALDWILAHKDEIDESYYQNIDDRLICGEVINNESYILPDFKEQNINAYTKEQSDEAFRHLKAEIKKLKDEINTKDQAILKIKDVFNKEFKAYKQSVDESVKTLIDDNKKVEKLLVNFKKTTLDRFMQLFSEKGNSVESILNENISNFKDALLKSTSNLTPKPLKVWDSKASLHYHGVGIDKFVVLWAKAVAFDRVVNSAPRSESYKSGEWRIKTRVNYYFTRFQKTFPLDFESVICISENEISTDVNLMIFSSQEWRENVNNGWYEPKRPIGYKIDTQNRDILIIGCLKGELDV